MAENRSPNERNGMRRTDPGLIMLSIAFLIVIMIVIAVFPQNVGPTVRASGTFYVNDCGESHGGFEYAGTFDALLDFDGRRGELSFSLRIGLGDPLDVHVFQIHSMEVNDLRMSIGTSVGTITMFYQESDDIWGDMFVNEYVTIYSPEKQEDEIGEISASMFGLPTHYYVQLGLHIDLFEERV